MHVSLFTLGSKKFLELVLHLHVHLCSVNDHEMVPNQSNTLETVPPLEVIKAGPRTFPVFSVNGTLVAPEFLVLC